MSSMMRLRQVGRRLGLAALILGVSASAARAQAPDPGSLLSDPGPETGLDTEFTPVAKDATKEAGWEVLGGAEFNGGGQLHPRSPTPNTVDFFTNAFATSGGDHGFFAGAQCIDTATAFDQLEECERAPAIYEYTIPPGQEAELRQVLGPEATGESERGYVAEIAWIGTTGKAIAVGGTGQYPRRELPRQGPAEEDAEYAARDLAGEEENAAGEARVWLYENGSWRELQGLPETAVDEPMAGLTTVDCSPRASDGEFCIAGGMRQLWMRHGEATSDHGFTESFTPTSTDDKGKPTVDDGAGWRFRVRSVRFVPGERPAVHAVAVTSGCCAASEVQNSPRLLLFDGKAWKARLNAESSLPGSAGTALNSPAGRAARGRQALPDSYYALNQEGTSLIVSSGAPSGGDSGLAEPTSRIAYLGSGGLGLGGTLTCAVAEGGHAFDEAGHLCAELANPRLATIRLVSGDGDFARPMGTIEAFIGDNSGPDGLMDWAVGVLRSSGQGIAYTTTKRGSAVQNPLGCTTETANTDCGPRDAAEIQQGTRSQSLFALPTYALNSFAFVPQSSVAWAAGDRGGIARLGGEGGISSLTAEPEMPRLGARRRAELAASSPYDGLTPSRPDAEVGAVPPLGDQTVRLEEPALIPTGSPDPSRATSHSVAAIAMSRDGGEGWALGGAGVGDGQGTVFRYTGGRWTLCKTSGLRGQTEPDPACDALAPLYGKSAVGIRDATRIPLENDGDPTNDDEFEAIAIGDRFQASDGTSAEAVLRYREGHWSIDLAAMRGLSTVGASSLRSIAFTAPDDGWALAADHNGSALFHFDGKRWTSCTTEPAACGQADVLPLGGASRAGAGQPSLTAVGRRLYLSGTRLSAAGDSGTQYPFIYSIDMAEWQPAWHAELDPGCARREGGSCVASEDRSDQGVLSGLSVATDANGELFGWATGNFGSTAVQDPTRTVATGDQHAAPLLRLTHTGGSEAWEPYSRGDAADDYLLGGRVGDVVLALSGSDDGEAFIAPPAYSGGQPMLQFGADERWELLPAPFSLTPRDSLRWMSIGMSVQEMAPDGQGGFWLVARQVNPSAQVNAEFFYHYTDRAPVDVLEDTPHPIRERITDLASGPEGQVWVTTDTGTVYRYDPVFGWERVSIPGWDPGRFVARPSSANAVTIGPDGSGIVVGEEGRIANVDPAGVRLDAAAGARQSCNEGSGDPVCGTGYNLTAAAVAADGSAMVGGQSRALLWRPAGGTFRAIAKPATAINATLTDIAMPSPDRAWVATDTGQVFAGSLSEGSWSWALENRNRQGQLITLNAGGQGMRLNGLAIDASGHGYAVGERGLTIERTGDPELPWRRVDSGVTEDLYSVAVPQSGNGRGALFGGELGLILTLADGRIEVARTDEPTAPLVAARGTENTGRVLGLALQSGSTDGQAEAWAATQVPGSGNGTRSPAPGAILHYSSDPEDPLLNPAGEATEPLADAARASPGELSFTAFGRSDCHIDAVSGRCLEPQGTTFTNEVVTARIVEEIERRAAAPGAPQLALFTGDVDHSAGDDSGLDTPLEASVIHNRWGELVADPLAEEGISLFSAVGVQDLAQVQACSAVGGDCFSTTRHAGVGTTGPWRESFAEQAAPWGSGGEASRGSLSFEPVPGQEGIVEPEELTGGERGARTHYAVDIVRDGEPIARLIVLDNSLRSLAASDAQQNPIEVQADFLERMLCYRDSGGDCSRRRGQEAIVMANTPTYSYDPSASGGGTETATDAATFETLLLRGDADLLVSGRLGWNGLYYTLAPGLHCPSPGGEHPDGSKPPSQSAAAGNCDEGAQDVLEQLQRQPDAGAVETVNEVAGGTPTGVLPTLVASGAGGTFGPVNKPVDGPASRGFWHGYSVVHLDTETGDVRVEQRPVFDWIGISADTHEVESRERVTLEGYGREVPGSDTPLRYDDIDSYAITHRYDLLLADPEEPWLPCEAADEGCRTLQERLGGSRSFDSASGGAARSAQDDNGGAAASVRPAGDDANPCEPYLCLPERIGAIDRVTGEVRAGDGKYPDTFALALLSVGDKAATYPLAFRKSPSFVASAPRPISVPPPLSTRPASLPPAEAPPPIPKPSTPQPNLPEPPVLPGIPPLVAASPPEPQPPAPPAPPPPSEQPSPLDLTVSPTALTVATPTAVIQPPTPPVNPAPPSGARREARQRQAAAQKSGADAESEDTQGEGGVDPRKASGLVNPIDSVQEATRYRDRPQPSAWAREALSTQRPGQASAGSGPMYVGSVVLMALVLGLGWSRGRPTPRKRQPELPALAWNPRR